MSGDLGRGGLSRHVSVRTPEVHPPARLFGQTAARVAGLDAEKPLRMWNEDQGGRCRGCNVPLPLPDEASLPVEDETVTIVSETGPVFLVDGAHRTFGSMSRNRHWYCIACAVNHPNGEAVRKVVLEEGWGLVYAWDQAGGPYENFVYLAEIMHSAARSGARFGLPRLSLSGLKYGDLWILPRSVLAFISRCAVTRGFPLDRPELLADRIKWSGRGLAGLVGSSPWREIEKFTFVMLQSSCLRRHEYATLPKRWEPTPTAEPAAGPVVRQEGAGLPPGGEDAVIPVDPFDDPFRAPRAAGEGSPEEVQAPEGVQAPEAVEEGSPEASQAGDPDPGEGGTEFPDLPLEFEDEEPEL